MGDTRGEAFTLTARPSGLDNGNSGLPGATASQRDSRAPSLKYGLPVALPQGLSKDEMEARLAAKRAELVGELDREQVRTAMYGSCAARRQGLP